MLFKQLVLNEWVCDIENIQNVENSLWKLSKMQSEDLSKKFMHSTVKVRVLHHFTPNIIPARKKSYGDPLEFSGENIAQLLARIA